MAVWTAISNLIDQSILSWPRTVARFRTTRHCWNCSTWHCATSAKNRQCRSVTGRPPWTTLRSSSRGDFLSG